MFMVCGCDVRVAVFGLTASLTIQQQRMGLWLDNLHQQHRTARQYQSGTCRTLRYLVPALLVELAAMFTY